MILAQLLASGIAVGSLYAMVALGFTLVWNASSTVNFAQGQLGVAPAVLANALFLPMAGKLRTLSKQEMQTYEIITTGMQSLVAGENTHILELRLPGFLPSSQRLSNLN